ncbi:MAG: septum formation protein [Hyphomonadaceae bacterium]|nr:MAG: septum formation protein [Hyphomonadaceae bacterium]KAF0187166.1 MAG: septum formation protein [Hyphomonadaceae bacterium]
MLADAGLEFTARDSMLDEENAKIAMREQQLNPAQQAHELALLKAKKISNGNDDFVIGCDQILALNGQAFDKAHDMECAKERLKALRGKAHVLETAIAIAREGKLIWRYDASPRLVMRDFSDEFLDNYLNISGERILSSVGCYQLEGMGSQLFEKIDGDYFSILGLPLLELLAYLRLHKIAET